MARKRKLNPTIIVDTREQLPYVFSGQQTRRQALDTGDYSLLGMTGLVCVERKTLDDFVNTFIKSKDRFQAELERMMPIKHRVIVVEGDIKQILNQEYASGAHPNAVIGFSVSLLTKYHIPCLFFSNRQQAEMWVERYLSQIFNNEVKHWKEVRDGNAINDTRSGRPEGQDTWDNNADICAEPEWIV